MSLVPYALTDVAIWIEAAEVLACISEFFVRLGLQQHSEHDAASSNHEQNAETTPNDSFGSAGNGLGKQRHANEESGKESTQVSGPINVGKKTE